MKEGGYPFIVGLTGGIGSGKTAASDWFATQGVHIVDADVVARQVVGIGQPALEQIKKEFGTWAIQSDGSLNREAMRNFIFTHTDARKQLESITHPLIDAEIKKQIKESKSEYSILVSPLLLEGNQHKFVNYIVLIDVPESIQLERASERDHQSTSQIQKIISVQMPRHEKLLKVDKVVDNSSSIQALHHQLYELHQYFREKADSYRH